MAPRFSELLNKPMNTVERPKLLPAGTYFGFIKGYSFDVSKKKKTPYVEFQLTTSSAGPDVDPADLEGVDLSKKSLRKVFYLTDDSMYRVVEFLQALGIEESASLNAAIPQAVNAEVMYEITVAVDDNGEPTFNEVGKIGRPE